MRDAVAGHSLDRVSFCFGDRACVMQYLADALHERAVFEIEDGSHLAFFETPTMPFELKEQHDFDLHIALEVEPSELATMLENGRARGIETRGISDHDSISSIYFRDPNGYVVELCAKHDSHDARMDPAQNGAREVLWRWIRERAAAKSRLGSPSPT